MEERRRTVEIRLSGHPEAHVAPEIQVSGKDRMGTDDKLDAKADELKGKVKEGVGDATDDKGLETEGKVDQAKGHLSESAEKVKDAFKKEAVGHFAFGWAWLCDEGGKAVVISLHDGDTPVGGRPGLIPLLTCDVWEHAYYLDY